MLKRCYLYVARGNAGLLKVGRTHYPTFRVLSLRQEFRRFGQELEAITFTRGVLRRIKERERQLIQSMRNLGLSAIKGREWFQGGNFDDAVAIAHRISLKRYEARTQKQ